MSEVLQNLGENLKQQVKLYEELYDLEQGKQKALIENNIQRIEAASAREEQIVLTSNSLEKERLLWTKQIGRELGLEAEDLTLTELAVRFPILQDVRSNMEGVVKQLLEIHKINSLLLKRAMKIVDFTLGLLTHQASNTYSYPGQKRNDEDKKRHLMDWRI